MRGKSAVLPGLYQDPSVAALAMAINNALGNVGKTVTVSSEPAIPIPSDQLGDFKALVADLNAGKVDWLVILNANPIYDAPADLDFADAFNKANIVAHLGSHYDETGHQAHWHIPAAHYLEYWSDARAYDGTVSIVQPMIDPLYGGHTAHDVFQALLDDPMVSPYDAVRETWKPNIKGDFETGWRKALHDGWIADTAYDKGARSAARNAPVQRSVPTPTPKDSLEIIFRPDPNIYDGRWNNVGWLQELPKPVTNLSWDNAAIVSGATLEQLGLEEDDIVEITVGNGTREGAGDCRAGPSRQFGTVYLGYGREFAGRVGSGQGFNAYLIRNTWAPFYATGSIRKVEGKWGIAITKSHYQDQRGATVRPAGHGNNSLEADEALGPRGIIRYATLDEFKANPNFAHEGEGHDTPTRDTSLFPNWPYNEANAWAMSIDMNSCTGCNACIVSCYAENNIAVVGKQQVRIGRNMQWLRIDSYFEGDLSAPRAHFQPMNCQHCENAPCEQVCPVGATVHTPEGLNMMVYNRCVGTRYCSNNCPYKVRRFNFLLFSDYETESLKLMRNPDVSVRSRGVMEKCSYCVQRIKEAKIEADKENRNIRDGEIVTACQQACPAEAIVFGNMNDPNSRVSKLRAQQRSYQVIADQNTRPRTHVSGRSVESESGTRRDADGILRRQRVELRRWRPEEVKPADPMIDPATGEFRVIAPGQTFLSITEKIARIVLTPHTPMGWFALFTVAGGGATMLLVAVTWLFLKGVGIWAITQPVAWGFAIINFVWWIGIGHAGTLISAILLLVQAGLAQRHQPLRRGHDDLRRDLRRHVPADSRGPSVAGILAVSAALHHDGVAAVPVAAAVGRFRGFDLRDDFGGVLVHRHGAGFGTLRDRSKSKIGAVFLRHAVAWAGADRCATGCATRRLRCCWPAWPRRWCSRCIRSSASISPLRFCRAGTRRSSRPTLSPAPSTPDLPWCSRWRFRCASSITLKRWSPSATSTTWAR